MSVFDDLAATWDAEPERVARARLVAERLREALDLRNVESAIDYGCGTGQLSFALADVLPHCLLMDSSVEMLRAAERGIESRKLPWNTDQRDLGTDSRDHPKAAADLVMALQVLHHVGDLATTLANMARALRPGGHLAIIDLPAGSEAFHRNSVHDPAENPHLGGFSEHELEHALRSAGFTDITWHAPIEVERSDGEGSGTYSLFLVTALREPSAG